MTPPASTSALNLSILAIVVVAVVTAGLCTNRLTVRTQRLGRRARHARDQDDNDEGNEGHDDDDDDDDDDHTARDDKEVEPVHSILHHFAALQLDPETTVEEANKRRTASYYLKARQAHSREIVRGVPSMTTLLALRQQHVQRSLRYSTMGTHSHRTVVVMCDASTAALLDEARRTILAPLQYSHDIHTAGVWIPPLDLIPATDMHVTIAIPWWWHTMRKQNNYELSQELAARFRQTLFLKFHHPFQVELQQIVLLGGQTLVALWRCVGERVTEEGHVVYDRHGMCVDPFVRLRVEIVQCFTKESTDNRLKPLTYQDVIQPSQVGNNATEARSNNLASPLKSASSLPTVSSRSKDNAGPTLTREHSIEMKTPGLGSGDGFIHTTLCRLPLDCLSQKDVSLAQVHRMCRELTASMSGHRLVVSKFRFLETTGIGGLSNPCVEPIYDEIIEAPSRFKVKRNGRVNEIANLHVLPQDTTGSNRTIGAIRNRVSPGLLEGLFKNGTSQESLDETIEELKHQISTDESPDEEVDPSEITITAPVLI